MYTVPRIRYCFTKIQKSIFSDKVLIVFLLFQCLMEQETGGPAAPRRSARILGRRGIEVLQQLHDGVTGQALDVEWVEDVEESSQNEYREDTEILPVIQNLKEWVKTPWELSKEK